LPDVRETAPPELSSRRERPQPGLLLSIVVALTLVAPAVASTSSYSVIDLGRTTEFGKAINASGHVAGVGDQQAFLFDGSSLTAIPPADGGTFDQAFGMNDDDSERAAGSPLPAPPRRA